MEPLKWQTKVVVLWISAAVAMSAHMILMILDPSALQKAGQCAATAGILLTILNTYHFLVCALPILPGGPYAGPTVHHILLVGSTVVSTGLVTWLAWTWPGRNARPN